MAIRVIPYEYPTIPGQSTNSGEGGDISLQYVDLSIAQNLSYGTSYEGGKSIKVDIRNVIINYLPSDLTLVAEIVTEYKTGAMDTETVNVVVPPTIPNNNFTHMLPPRNIWPTNAVNTVTFKVIDGDGNVKQKGNPLVKVVE